MAKYIITIIALAVVIYVNSLGGEFVSDDVPQIVNNPSIGTLEGCRSVLTCANSLIYRFSGLNSLPFHIFSLFFYCLCCVLVFYFLLSFFGIGPSFLGALLFTAHPIHTEAVSWISGLPYVVSTILIISSFLLYKQATKAGFKGRSYWLSVLLQALNFMTCWYAIIFPLMIVLYDLVYRRVKKCWRFWIPFFSLIVFWALIYNTRAMLSQRMATLAADTGAQAGASNPFFNLIFSFFKHGQLMVFPSQLTLYHEPLTATLPMLMLGGAVLIVVLCSLPFLFKRAKPFLFGLSIYVLFFLPSYSPKMISWLVAERYAFLPSLGFCLMVMFLLDKLAVSQKARNFMLIGLIIVTGMLSVRTILRNEDWKTRASLWHSTAKVSPLSPKAHNNMGDIYGLEGDVKRASESFRRATELRPDYADAYHNLANTYQQLGRSDEAIDNYEKAISANPSLYQSYQNLGIIYFNQGRPGLAMEYFDRSLAINPDNRALALAVEKIKENQ